MSEAEHRKMAAPLRAAQQPGCPARVFLSGEGMCAALSGYAHAAFFAGERDALRVLGQSGSVLGGEQLGEIRSVCDTPLFTSGEDGDEEEDGNDEDGDEDEDEDDEDKDEGEGSGWAYLAGQVLEAAREASSEPLRLALVCAVALTLYAFSAAYSWWPWPQRFPPQTLEEGGLLAAPSNECSSGSESDASDGGHYVHPFRTTT